MPIYQVDDVDGTVLWKNDNLKMAALWDITLCSLRVDDGGNKHL
jgi:hypothetical protein